MSAGQKTFEEMARYEMRSMANLDMLDMNWQNIAPGQVQLLQGMLYACDIPALASSCGLSEEWILDFAKAEATPQYIQENLDEIRQLGETFSNTPMAGAEIEGVDISHRISVVLTSNGPFCYLDFYISEDGELDKAKMRYISADKEAEMTLDDREAEALWETYKPLGEQFKEQAQEEESARMRN